jgi:hypothetical protein
MGSGKGSTTLTDVFLGGMSGIILRATLNPFEQRWPGPHCFSKEVYFGGTPADIVRI